MMRASTPEALQLMMEGSQAFADIEANGMRIDVAYLDKAIKWADQKAKELEKELRQDEVYATWRRVYGEKTDLGSPKQLGHVIFDVLKVPCKHRTKTGRPKTDVEALEAVEFPFIKRLVDLKKLQKASGTY